jgi:hypothetical protein
MRRRWSWRHFRLLHAVCGTTSYEMCGDYLPRLGLMGGRRWAETDLNGVEYWFRSKSDATKFIESD